MKTSQINPSQTCKNIIIPELSQTLRTRGVPLPSRILLISPIAEMQGEFANTLVIEMGADNASRVREVE